MRAHCAIIESMKTTEKSNNPTKLNKPNNNLIIGTILTLTAGIAWGLSGASGQYLMAHGFPVLALTNLRLLVAVGVPMKRLADPLEVGELFAFLGSDEASYLTGSQIVIDGGSTLPETMSIGTN